MYHLLPAIDTILFSSVGELYSDLNDWKELMRWKERPVPIGVLGPKLRLIFAQPVGQRTREETKNQMYRTTVDSLLAAIDDFLPFTIAQQKSAGLALDYGGAAGIKERKERLNELIEANEILDRAEMWLENWQVDGESDQAARDLVEAWAKMGQGRKMMSKGNTIQGDHVGRQSMVPRVSRPSNGYQTHFMVPRVASPLGKTPVKSGNRLTLASL